MVQALGFLGDLLLPFFMWIPFPIAFPISLVEDMLFPVAALFLLVAPLSSLVAPLDSLAAG